MNNLYILKATINDVSPVNTLINSAYRGDASRKGWTNEIGIIEGDRMDETEVGDMIQSGGGALFKAVNEEGGIVGCVFLEVREHQLYMGTLTVSPDIQDQGIGKQLLQFAEEYARDNHCTAIVMTVISGRYELISWYLRHGYRLTGESMPFPAENRFGRPLKVINLLYLTKDLFV